MPSYWLFGLALVVIGVSAQTFTTTTNSMVQLSTEPAMRGRVMAILLAIALGGTPIGAPIVGWVADRFGPRWALGVGAASGFAAAIVGVCYLAKYRHLRVRVNAGRFRFTLDDLDTEPASSLCGLALRPARARWRGASSRRARGASPSPASSSEPPAPGVGQARQGLGLLAHEALLDLHQPRLLELREMEERFPLVRPVIRSRNRKSARSQADSAVRIASRAGSCTSRSRLASCSKGVLTASPPRRPVSRRARAAGGPAGRPAGTRRRGGAVPCTCRSRQAARTSPFGSSQDPGGPAG